MKICTRRRYLDIILSWNESRAPKIGSSAGVCLTISHTREWTLLPSLTSASSRADSLLALTPGTETIFSVLPPFVTHQITLSTPLPSSFPFHILLFPPNVRPFTTPPCSSFIRHPHSFLFFRSFSSPSLSLKEVKYLYSIMCEDMFSSSITFHFQGSKCCHLQYVRALDLPDVTWYHVWHREHANLSFSTATRRQKYCLNTQICCW